METINDEFGEKNSRVFLFLLDLTSPSGFCEEAMLEKIGIHGLCKVILFNAYVCLKLSKQSKTLKGI